MTLKRTSWSSSLGRPSNASYEANKLQLSGDASCCLPGRLNCSADLQVITSANVHLYFLGRSARAVDCPGGCHRLLSLPLGAAQQLLTPG